MSPLSLCVYVAVSFAAGIINVLAGGGSFITFPALLMTGLDARAANITSTIALFPMQITTGYATRKMASGTDHISMRLLTILSAIAGALGAALLLMTPTVTFSHLVPWFTLFATSMFAWSTFSKKPVEAKPSHRFGKIGMIAAQFVIGVYGGYFGAGIGILMLASLSLAGLPIKKAAATKNILVAVTNAVAVLIFVFSPDAAWIQIGVGMIAAIAGAQVGIRLLHKVNEKYMRIFVILWGLALSIAFFLRA